MRVALIVAACAAGLSDCTCDDGASADLPRTDSAIDGGDLDHWLFDQPGRDSAAPFDASRTDARLPDTRLIDTRLPDTNLLEASLPDTSSADRATCSGFVGGVFSVVGTDPDLGGYHGQAEIRPLTAGLDWEVFHLQRFDAANFEGDRIELAWQGTATASSQTQLQLQFALQTAGFITSYGALGRNATGNAPLSFTATVDCAAGSPATITFVAATSTVQHNFAETWTWQSASGPQPIWRNERELRPGHEPMDGTQLYAAFASFASFHQLPDVAVYAERPEFQAAVHYFVFDPTDFDFYQHNPDVLRVVQKKVDPISLAETRIRNRAFRQKLADKASYYDGEIPQHNLNRAGMVSYFDSQTAQSIPDGDALEWTGDYLTSQALRYLVTSDASARTNMLRALDGLLLCHTIVGQPGQFARTIRDHAAGSSDWVQGLPPHESFDWMPGCNNDMLKGYQSGFLWSYLVLSGESNAEATTYIARMIAVTQDLLANNADASDQRTNSMYFDLLLSIMTGDYRDVLNLAAYYKKYLAIYQVMQAWVVDFADGCYYDYGTADWSGVYMTAKSLWAFWTMEHYLDQQDPEGTYHISHTGEFEPALAQCLKQMRYTRVGFLQLVTSTLGTFASPPPEFEDSLWVLREFPAPKLLHNIDWSINPEFCISPFPELPWKYDWTTSDRKQSLYGFPLFERNPDNIQWKGNPMVYRGGAGSVVGSGTEYLVAYWFGRYLGAIGENQ